MQTTDARQAVRTLATRIDRAWRQRELDDLPDCFDDDAVMVGPGPAVLGRGRAFFVESYREFATHATVLAYIRTDPVIEVFGDTAICVYDWAMTYQRGDAPMTERGSEELVAIRHGTQWRVVWRRVQIAAPAE